jgi:hypothetical protein
MWGSLPCRFSLRIDAIEQAIGDCLDARPQLLNGAGGEGWLHQAPQACVLWRIEREDVATQWLEFLRRLRHFGHLLRGEHRGRVYPDCRVEQPAVVGLVIGKEPDRSLRLAVSLGFAAYTGDDSLHDRALLPQLGISLECAAMRVGRSDVQGFELPHCRFVDSCGGMR